MLSTISRKDSFLALEGLLTSDDLEFTWEKQIDAIYRVILFVKVSSSHIGPWLQVIGDCKQLSWLLYPGEKAIEPFQEIDSSIHFGLEAFPD
jgi:hypothetical protein